MKSASDFHVFSKWLDAPSYAYGRQGESGIVPVEDKESYWRIFSEILDAAEEAIASRDDRNDFILRPKQFSRERGSRGHRPVDLWVSVCGREAEAFGYMPQVYAIASERGLEVGFAASIAEDDYFDADVKARNRTIVPFINAKLPRAEDALGIELDAALNHQDGWHFNSKTRLTPRDEGFDRFSTFGEWVNFLKTSGTATGGGCICRTFVSDQLPAVSADQQFSLALGVFAPLLARCSPSPWDIEVRHSQTVVEELSESVTFDPEAVDDERKTILEEVARRQGQAAFRSKLLDAYDGRCTITGTSVVDALQAAHITPYLGPETNHVSNGLLLRADVHNLFDLRLIKIHPETFVISISIALSGTDYWALNGKRIYLPQKRSDRPSQLALGKHFGH